MPELPEVEIAARSLGAQVLGRTIVAVERLDWERMVESPTPEAFCALLVGRRIEALARRAKWVLVRLDAGWTLAIHLRMSGRLAVAGPEESARSHVHLVLALDDGRRIFFDDERKFGRVRLLDAAGLAALDADHGPEPLDPAFGPVELAGCLRGRRVMIKPLLLDQRIVAGLGNIYVSEALWLARIHPQRTAATLSDEEIVRLHTAIRSVLEQAITNQGSTLRNYRNGYGQSGQNQEHFSVYDRMGQPCERCATPITRVVIAQRSTFFCSACQAP